MQFLGIKVGGLLLLTLLLMQAHLAACLGGQRSSQERPGVLEALLKQAPPTLVASGRRRSAALFKDTSLGWDYDALG